MDATDARLELAHRLGGDQVESEITVEEIAAELRAEPMLIAAFDLDRSAVLEALGGEHIYRDLSGHHWLFPVEDGDTDGEPS